MVAVAVSSTLAIIAQVVIGFAVSRAYDLPLATHEDFPSLAFLMSIPAACLGIACLVSILGHSVGLFLQEEL